MRPAPIAHADADCFYVSCERVRSPALIGQPVGVLGNQGACVIAKSYEMKATGVKTGMPIWDAVKLCPSGIYVKRDFRWYELHSRRLLDNLRAVSGAVEYYSIDEMFFDAGRLPDVFGKSFNASVEDLQKHLLHHALLPVSIGVAPSKTLAKLASDAAKPAGVHVLLDKPAIESFLSNRPVDEISGIGSRSKAKLARHGILSCLDFAKAPAPMIRKLLTVRGAVLHWEINGNPARPILTERPPHKTISRGGSLGGSTANKDRLRAWVVRNTERLVEELDFYQVHTRRLVLILRFKEGGSWGRGIALPQTTARFDLLVLAAKCLLEAGHRDNGLVSGMHLVAEKLSSRRVVQGHLFPHENLQAERTAFVKKFVNDRAGRFAVRSGDTLYLPDIYADKTNEYDICDVHGKHCF